MGSTKKLDAMLGNDEVTNEMMKVMEVFLDNGFDEGIKLVEKWKRDEL
jgi:hypothetical protein